MVALMRPFPAFYAENVFPIDFYERLLDQIDAKRDYSPNPQGKFANRTFADDIGIPELDFMFGPDFLKAVVHLFEQPFMERFGDKAVKLTRDLRLIRDSKEYKIGPHTDAPWKLISLLFYLPRDASMREYGTSILVPNDPRFKCEGGPHYDFEPCPGISPGFREVWRAPFLPNTCLGFWKTSRSFHGVYPIPEAVRRDVLLYNVYVDNAHE
jgi:hypothetical protein